MFEGERETQRGGRKVPFRMDDVDKWKNLDPDGKDVDLILDAMTETEKQLVLKAARAHVAQRQLTGLLCMLSSRGRLKRPRSF